MNQNDYRVMSAIIGNINGVHQQFVRPPVVSCTQRDLESMYESTRGYSQINTLSVSNSNVTTLSTDTSVKAKMDHGWGNERSNGIIVIDVAEPTTRGIERYILSFFIPTKSVHGNVVDHEAILEFNSCTKIEVSANKMAGLKTDLIQRMSNSNRVLVVPNRTIDVLGAIPYAKEGELTIGSGSPASRANLTLGDGSNLVSADGLATTLKAIDNSSRALTGRNSTNFNIAEETHHDTICTAAESYVAEGSTERDPLINFIIESSGGSHNRLKVPMEQVIRTLGGFEFRTVETEMGDVDFTDTAQFNTINGAMAQNIINQVLGLMIRNCIVKMSFQACNTSGHIELTVREDWMTPIDVEDINGVDIEAHARRLSQLEATMQSQLRSVILPQLLTAPGVDFVADISLVTTAVVDLQMGGREEIYSLQSATSSAWTTINAGEHQQASRALAYKGFLKAIESNAHAQQ